jgi:hypothetical protein
MNHAVLTATILWAAVGITFAQQDKQPADQGAPAKSSEKATSPETSKPGVVAIDSITSKATVEDVDLKNRTVTLKDEEGKTEKVKVGPEVRNLDQVKKGDTVRTTYYQSAIIQVRKPTNGPSRREREVLVRAPRGQTPAGAIVNTAEITATIEDIDYEKRTVTLKGPEGNVRTLKVSPDVKNLSDVKKGDELLVDLTEALAIEVSKP